MASLCFQERVQAPEQRLRWLPSLIFTLLQDCCPLLTPGCEGSRFALLPLFVGVRSRRFSWNVSQVGPLQPIPAASGLDKAVLFLPLLLHLPKQDKYILTAFFKLWKQVMLIKQKRNNAIRKGIKVSLWSPGRHKDFIFLAHPRSLSIIHRSPHQEATPCLSAHTERTKRFGILLSL